jgi:hypothetical protein
LLRANLHHSIALQKNTFALTVFALVISCTFVLSAPDTPETRRHDMADKMAANLPPDQRDQFNKLMTSQH